MGATRAARLDSLDLLRGFVMALMALDHTRDFWSSSRFDPTDLALTTPALFATRWITHLCAPTFMLLVGTGAYMSMARGMSKRSLSGFLVKRGLWMIVLEFGVSMVCRRQGAQHGVVAPLPVTRREDLVGGALASFDRALHVAGPADRCLGARQMDATMRCAPARAR